MFFSYLAQNAATDAPCKTSSTKTWKEEFCKKCYIVPVIYCMLYAICYMLYCTCNASIEHHPSSPSGPHVRQHPASLRQDPLTCCNSVSSAKKESQKIRIDPRISF